MILALDYWGGAEHRRLTSCNPKRYGLHAIVDLCPYVHILHDKSNSILFLISTLFRLPDKWPKKEEMKNEIKFFFKLYPGVKQIAVKTNHQFYFYFYFLKIYNEKILYLIFQKLFILITRDRFSRFDEFSIE